MIPETRGNYNQLRNHIKKARESELIAHPALEGSRIAFLPRISNAEAHAVYNIMNTQSNGY